MRFQLSIRDLLLALAIIALAAGWFIDHKRINRLSVQKWEFKSTWGDDSPTSRDLNSTDGDNGWELCGVYSGKNQPVLYFKRPKQ